MGINKVILVGYVGKDPEIADVNGTKVAKFSLATSESWKDKNGEKQTKTEWHNIIIWRNLAEVVEKWVKKGMQLYIEGKVTYRSYEKDGETKYFTEIVASSMEMLGGGDKKEQPKPQAQAQPKPQVQEDFKDNDDDLPF